MWQGSRNVETPPVRFVSLGMSSQSSPNHSITLHNQHRWVLIYLFDPVFINIECQCIITHVHGSQFRQVYSITHITINHSQTQRDNTTRMQIHQRRVIWEKASLVITHSKSITLFNSSDGVLRNAFWPNWMYSTWGKSMQLYKKRGITLKYNTMALSERPIAKDKWFERRHI